MKTLTILLLTLLFPIFAIGETIDDLVERDDIYYKKFSDTPFTGKITGKARVSFKNGKRHGLGTWKYPNGNIYVGEFKDGKRHGQGTHTSANGDTYVGKYENDKKNGWGTNTWADGLSKYVGEFKDGLTNGWGTFNYSNGDTYVGDFKNDYRHGKGTYTYRNTTKQKIGEWEKGEFVKGQTIEGVSDAEFKKMNDFFKKHKKNNQ